MRRFVRRLPVAAAGAALFAGCAASTVPRDAGTVSRGRGAHAEMREEVAGLLRDPALAQAQVGIKAVSLYTGETLFERQAGKLFLPASNMKLYTTAAGLRFLGADFRFRTIVGVDPAAEGGAATLYLQGRGDPGLRTEDLLSLAYDVKAAGIEAVGDLVADDGYFDDWTYGQGWMYDGADYWYSAPIGALGVNDNCVRVVVRPGDAPGDAVRVSLDPPTRHMTVVDSAVTSADTTARIRVRRNWRERENTIVVTGSIGAGLGPVSVLRNVENPALYTAALLGEFLRALGVAVEGGVRKGTMPASADTAAVHESPPLSQLVAGMNKPSNNLDVEMLLKTLGAERSGPPGTAEKGIEAVAALLREAGVSPDSLRMEDGSGLSRYNRVSPEQTIRLLEFMYERFDLQPEFLTSLPVGGIDGTLTERFAGSAMTGRVRAKTGTLSGASTLSGYAETADGEVLAFSIMMQGFLGEADGVRALQDRIVGALCRSRRTKDHPNRRDRGDG